MAAIDKIYLKSYDEYIQFRDWLIKQPKLKDKYGKEVSLMRYFFDYWDKPSWFDKDGNAISHPVYRAPCYVDAYIIRNCPLDFVQEELMLNYGYWSQRRIHEFYERVKNYNPDKDGAPYWAKLEDFIFNEDGHKVSDLHLDIDEARSLATKLQQAIVYLNYEIAKGVKSYGKAPLIKSIEYTDKGVVVHCKQRD